MVKKVGFGALLLFTALIMFLLTGCSYKEVPPGFVGSCKTNTGFSKPTKGAFSCWEMIGVAVPHYLEASHREHKLPLKVLCKDSLEFSFSLNVLASVQKGQEMDLLQNGTPTKRQEVGATYLTSEDVFNRYARSLIDQEARRVVSKYETREIVQNVDRIILEVNNAVLEALSKQDIPITVHRITVNELSFPEVITKAQQVRAQREVEIETEKAEQAKVMLKLENEIKRAEADYKRRLLEAAAIADANKIIGGSVTPGYLAWWQLKVFSEAAQGPNNWGFIPYTDHTQGAKSDFSKVVVDAALEAKVKAMMPTP